MEKDLPKTASSVIEICEGKEKSCIENNFDYFQKTAAFTPRVCYNKSISQNDLVCSLQAKEI